jgi:hypothetical protein
MAEHTPGPWAIASGAIHMRGEARVQMALIRAMPSVEYAANLRLIGAAPDLLDALREMTEVAGRALAGTLPALGAEHLRDPAHDALKRARAAIAKATGEGSS